MKKNIAIVGGSISGCVCAILMSRLGHQVTVFERSDGPLHARGAGINLPRTLLDEMIERNIIGKDFPKIHMDSLNVMPYDYKTGKLRHLTSLPLNSYAVHWGNLYIELLRHVPKHIISYGKHVTEVTQDEHSIHLTINNDLVETFDFCIFADGYSSIGRAHYYPDLQTRFSGYIAWRGNLDRQSPEIEDLIMGKMPFFMYENGYLMFYAIPKMDTLNPRKEYIINWLLFEDTTKDHTLFKNNKEDPKRNFAEGHLPEHYKTYFRTELANIYFPELETDILLATENPYIQAICDSVIPHYAINNACLIGDASVLVRPQTAAGATKAILDALALYDNLQEESDLTAALQKWDDSQVVKGEKLYGLSEALGNLWIMKQPDFLSMSKEQLDQMVKAIATKFDWYYIKK